jgi:adenylate cyclase
MKLPSVTLTPKVLASLLSVAATLGVTLLLSWALVAGRTPELLQRLDLQIYDTWVRQTAQPAGEPQVTVLELDEASLLKLGQWPWPRDRIAQIVQQTFDTYGARALAFDSVFAEPDRSDAAAIQQRLARVPPGADNALRQELQALVEDLDRDRQLAQALKGRNVVLGYYFNADPASRTGALPEPWLPAEMAQALGIRALSGPGYGANLEVLVQAAKRAGHFNPRLDLDGVTRRIPLLTENDGMLYTSLTLGVLSLLAGDNAAIDFGPAMTSGGREVTEALTVGPYKLPVDGSGQALVPFFGGRGSLPRVGG